MSFSKLHVLSTAKRWSRIGVSRPHAVDGRCRAKGKL
jgi:hypothetical protein